MSSFCLEDRSGAVHWPSLLELARSNYLSADTVALLKDRLKAEATHIVLNTLTVLHTISLNGSKQVRDQLGLSKCMKHLGERLLNKPPFPGVEMAAAQLLIDWAFLYGSEELGVKSFQLLTNTSKHRAMLQAMQASDVAVLLREDHKLGMPQFARVLRGLDFARVFATQFASPLTGTSAPPSVLTQLAKAAVAASYSDSSTAAAAAATSRNTFAAWAERVQQNPQAAAQRVLDSRQAVETDTQALSAAQAACLAAARVYIKPNGSSSSSSSSATAALAHGSSSSSSGQPGQAEQYTELRHELDKAYLVACKCTEWREMIQVLVQQALPDSQLSALLSLADLVNATLEEWQAAATTELFWLLGVDTAGLADGSLLRKIAPAAATAAATAGSTAAAAGGQAQQQQQQQQGEQQQQQHGLRQSAAGAFSRSSYLDLLTGDALPPSSSSNPFSNPFLTGGSSSAAAAAPVQQPAAAVPPEIQGYMQETCALPAAFPVAAPAAAATVTGQGSLYPVQQQQQPQQQQQLWPSQQQPTCVQPHQHLQQQQQPPVVRSSSTGYPQQQQLSRSSYSSSSSGQPSSQPLVGMSGATRPSSTSSSSPSMSHQQYSQPLVALSSTTRSSSSSSSSGLSRPISAGQHAVTDTTAARSAALTVASSAGAAAAVTGEAAAAGSAAVGAAGAATAGDTGSSADSASGGFNYINPFAALDTSSIISSLKISSPRNSVDGGAAATAAAAAAAAGLTVQSRGSKGSSTLGPGSPLHQHTGVQQQHWQQQQKALLMKKREPPLPPLASAGDALLPGQQQQQQQPAGGNQMSQPPGHHHQQQQQQQQAAALQRQQQLAAGGASVPTAGAAAAARAGMHPAAAHSQVPPGVELLQYKLQEVLAACSSSSSRCQACSLPPGGALQASLLQLLVAQQQEFKARLQQLQQQHQAEVADLKATAVKRFKELQQELEQAKQQLQG